MFLNSHSTSSTPRPPSSLSPKSYPPTHLQRSTLNPTFSLSLSDSTVMKKLYRRGTVHPSPPVISDHLSFLPAAILTLVATLSPDEREVLAYLVSCFNANTSFSNFNGCRKTGHKSGCGKAGSDHLPLFKCDCFSCYTSFWVRWDSSPNRHLIHEIIDAYEEGLAQGTRDNRKERKKKNHGSGTLNKPEIGSWKSESDSSGEASNHDGHGGIDGGSGGCDGEEEIQKGSMRRLVSFLGEKVWGTWNRPI